MATMRLTNRQQVEDFVRGGTFFGTGGGGLPQNGIRSLMDEIEAGRNVGWVDVSEITDDMMSCCPFLMGSPAPYHDEATIKEMASYDMTPETSVNLEGDRMFKAVLALQEYTGKKFDVIVPLELAGANTSAAMAAASKLGIVTVDGDYTGRAIPEIVQITYNYNGHCLTPIASVDEWGNECIIKSAINPRTAEHIGKMISLAAYGMAGQAGMALDGKNTRDTIIPGTLSQCYEAGKTMREAKEAGKDVIKEILAKFGGYELGRGTITAKDDYDAAGYYWGTVTVDCGENEFKYWFKNENHVLWKNGEPYVTSPDIIAGIDLETGEPVHNPLSYVGQKVALVAMRCKPQQENAPLLMPRHFGFDIDHVPVDEVMGK